MNPFCNHEPVLLHREVFPSKIEVLRREGAGFQGQAFPLDLEKMSTQKTVLVFSCKKCGEILKTIEATN